MYGRTDKEPKDTATIADGNGSPHADCEQGSHGMTRGGWGGGGEEAVTFQHVVHKLEKVAIIHSHS